eukprot:s3811_g2.t2
MAFDVRLPRLITPPLWTHLVSLHLVWIPTLLKPVRGESQEPVETVDPEAFTPEDFPCSERDVKIWEGIKEVMREMVSRYSGRLSFVNMEADVPFVKSVQSQVSELLLPGQVFDPEIRLPWREGLEWTTCHSGVLTVRLLFVATKQLGRPGDVPDLATTLVASALMAPWISIIQSGWPIFNLLAMLSRWASPFLDGPGALLTSHGRSARQKAITLQSRCDAGEAGATKQARELIGGLWRHLDPDAWRGNESVQAKPMEEALARLANLHTYHIPSAVRGQSCYWTRHPTTVAHEASDALKQFAASAAYSQVLASCAESPDCVGARMDTDPTLLSELPISELSSGPSFLLWCSPMLKRSSSEDGIVLQCPLSRAVGLLTTAYRRFSESRESFTPELVIEAQAEVRTVAKQIGDVVIGMEAWLSQWPLLQVLAKIQQRMDLLGDPIAGSPASTALPSLQRAMGFDDEAWRLVLTELHSAAHMAAVPQALRERVLCTSRRSCAAEFFARLQLLLYAKKDLPLRDQIFLDKQDHLLSLQMLQSRAAEGEPKEYDWMKIVVEDFDRHAEGVQRSREDELRSMMPMDHPLQVDRMQLAHFILEVRDEIVSGGLMERCLEWDQPFLLASAFAGACQWMDVYSYSEPTPSNPNMGLPGRHRFPGGTLHYWGDMESEDRFGVDPESHDLILCPFIFEHVSQPWLAIRTLARTLRPGGFIVWAAPMYQRYHGSPHDYYRYTPKGVAALAKHAGLEVQRLFSPGDLSLVNGVLMGMLLPYWRPEQILHEEELHEKEDAPRYPLNVFALLRKPGTRPPLQNLLRTSQAFRPQLQEVAAKWPDFLTGILPRMSTVFQLTVVRHRASGRILVLANTHLFYHPNARHIRLLQIMCLLHEVQELRKQHKDAKGELPHIIFAGDLNCLPETGAVQLLLTGQVPSDHEDWETSSQFAWRDEEASADTGEAEEIPKSSVPSMEADETDVVEPLPREAWQKGSGIALQNPLGALVDVYANTPQKFTNYVHDFSGILDFSF